MFIAVYEFEAEAGREDEFRAAWLEVTRAIHREHGSLGSRLHTTGTPGLFVAYAQWPDRAAWEAGGDFADPVATAALGRMRACLAGMRTVYELEVAEDYLQDRVHGS